MQGDWRRKKNQNQRHNDQIVRKYDQVFPYHPQHMNCQRKFDLFDETFCRYERKAEFVDRRGNQQPGHEADRQIGKVRGNVLPQEAPVKRPHGTNQNAGTDRQPEWPQKRTAVALADFLPAQHRPDMNAK